VNIMMIYKIERKMIVCSEIFNLCPYLGFVSPMIYCFLATSLRRRLVLVMVTSKFSSSFRLCVMQLIPSVRDGT